MTAVAGQTTVDVGDVVNLTATAVDPEGESMTYSWTSDTGGDFGTPTALTTTLGGPGRHGIDRCVSDLHRKRRCADSLAGRDRNRSCACHSASRTAPP